MDLAQQVVIIKLAIAYTLLGAFIFTVVVTCLSIVGLVKFTKASQQNKLFRVLIVELVVIGIGSFTSLLQFNPKKVQQDIERPLAEETTIVRNKLQHEVMLGLEPKAALLAQELITKCESAGISLRLTSGYRSAKEQARYYAKLATASRWSTHMVGLAFDVAIVENGRLILDQKRYSIVGRVGEQLGLVWGGNWKFPSFVHFETKNAREVLKRLRDAQQGAPADRSASAPLRHGDG